MKIKIIISLLFIGLISNYSCQKENNPIEYPFKAEVMAVNPDWIKWKVFLVNL